ncbi:unnamed protein product [Nezara viridula]|uniref:PHD-type domain-containing protein n=1 Tax=Nezara viridula TaxID=85310 RepID=A0A9P0E7Q1_NEZVI|nr:unnamed protein product [Nezara viridula]
MDQTSSEELAIRRSMFPDVKDIVKWNLRCTACGRSIRRQIFKGDLIIIHPRLETLICYVCMEFLGNEEFSVDEDGTDKYCRWCGQGGKLLLCSSCPHAFCKRCIKRNLPENVQENTVDEQWKCYICDISPLYQLRAQCWAAQQYSDYIKTSRTSSKRSRTDVEEKSRFMQSKKNRQEDLRRKISKTEPKKEENDSCGRGSNIKKNYDLVTALGKSLTTLFVAVETSISTVTKMLQEYAESWSQAVKKDDIKEDEDLRTAKKQVEVVNESSEEVNLIQDVNDRTEPEPAEDVYNEASLSGCMDCSLELKDIENINFSDAIIVPPTEIQCNDEVQIGSDTGLFDEDWLPSPEFVPCSSPLMK